MKRRTKLLLLGGVALIALLPWLALVPMGLWRGTAVVESCDRKAVERFQRATYAVRGAEYMRAFPPALVCPLDNGESVSVSLFG